MTPLRKLSARVRVTGVSLIASLAVALLAMTFGSSPAKAQEDETYSLNATIVPGGITGTGKSYVHADISWIDLVSHHVLVADRGNSSVDVFDPSTDTYKWSLTSPNSLPAGEGPNGVATDASGNVWYGDDSGSLVEQTDALSPSTVCNVDVNAPNYSPGKKGTAGRADELAVDPVDHVVLIASPDAATTIPTPYITFVHYSAEGCHIIKRVFLPEAVDYDVSPAVGAVEQSQYSKVTGKFYLSIPYDNKYGGGAVLEINPKSLTVGRAIHDLGGCHPNGLALGPWPQALLVCNHDDDSTNKSATIIDLKDGHIVKKFNDIQGGDEGWYNSGDNHYYAAVNHNSTPEIGIIDASTLNEDDAILTAGSAHSVAADPWTNQVWVPEQPNASCPDTGCVKAYKPTPITDADDLAPVEPPHGHPHD